MKNEQYAFSTRAFWHWVMALFGAGLPFFDSIETDFFQAFCSFNDWSNLLTSEYMWVKLSFLTLSKPKIMHWMFFLASLTIAAVVQFYSLLPTLFLNFSGDSKEETY